MSIDCNEKKKKQNTIFKLCPRRWWRRRSGWNKWIWVYLFFSLLPWRTAKMLTGAHGEPIKAWNTSNLSFVCIWEKQAFITLCGSLLWARISEEQMCPCVSLSLFIYTWLSLLLLVCGPGLCFFVSSLTFSPPLITNDDLDLYVINKKCMNGENFLLLSPKYTELL